MNIEKFRDTIARRIHISETTQDEWDYGIDECCKKEIEILTEDVTSTIEFLKNDCTADEYSWISEVIEDVIDMIPSKELVQCYKELKNKYPEEYSEYCIQAVVENCEAILKQEEEQRG